MIFQRSQFQDFAISAPAHITTISTIWSIRLRNLWTDHPQREAQQKMWGAYPQTMVHVGDDTTYLNPFRWCLIIIRGMAFTHEIRQAPTFHRCAISKMWKKTTDVSIPMHLPKNRPESFHKLPKYRLISIMGPLMQVSGRKTTAISTCAMAKSWIRSAKKLKDGHPSY